MYDVDKIANWFIWYNEYIRDFENEDTDDITNMKLQKLLFYAQSAFLAIKGVPLFNNNILAWEHGPVIPEIYDKFKINGNKGITEYNENEIIIKRENDADDLILITAKKYNEILEELKRLKYWNELDKRIENIKAGKGEFHELIEVDDV